MVKFQREKLGYKREEVDDYIEMLVTEYKALQEELKESKAANRILKRKKKKLEERNQSYSKKENISYKETIAAAMMGAETSGKWIIEEARKEAAGVKKLAREEVRVIRGKKKEALREVRGIARRLQGILKEEQKKGGKRGGDKQ